MPPKKRRTGGNSEPSAPPAARTATPRPSTRMAKPGHSTSSSTSRTTPRASSRYTPPIKTKRFRPGWHKVVGGIALALGILIAVLNDVMLLGVSATLLPGGHSELYLILGLAIAGYSTWWFGWFDRAE